MPPEPLPWDRKEFFRDRKYGHDLSEPLGPGSGSGLGSRWRDSSYGGGGGGLHRSNNSNNSDFSPRWGFPSDFRRPPGHGKQQGGWHMYHEDYPSPRLGDRFLDHDEFRPAIPREDGRYGRFYRENRSSYCHKQWRYHWEPNHHHRNILPNTPSRPHFVKEHKSVDDKTNDVHGSSTGQKLEKENSSGSLEWKPLKWSSSSGYSHSSGSKSNGGESNDTKVDLSPKNVSPFQSPSGDAVACMPSVGPSDETSSRKKPRLGWGEGLAKYEKKKVDVPEENASNGVEVTNTPTSNLVDKSPRLPSFSNCSSPATPSSFACSSSPGVEDKAYLKTIDADTNNCSVSSMLVSENQLEESHFSLEKLELNLISNLSSLLNELLQASEQYPADSAFVKSSALSKLLLWKGDISKELELTETEIDLLENELKSMSSVFRVNHACPTSKGGPHGGISTIPRPPSLEVGSSGDMIVDETHTRLCDELKSMSSDSIVNRACSTSLDSSPVDCKGGPHGGISLIPRPPPLEVRSSGDMIVDETRTRLCDGAGEVQTENKDGEIDSPGSATSKFVEPLPVQNSLTAAADDSTNCVSKCADLSASTIAVDVKKIEGSSCSIDDNLCDAIINSNKECAARASDELYKISPSYGSCVDTLEASRVSCNGADFTIRDKFLRRKKFRKFKEKVMALKYRAFQHLWKDNLRVLSIMKSQRMKLHKKSDLSSHSLHGCIQKHRSSIRSRFSPPAAGSLSQIPTADIVSYTNKLLSESPAKVYRSSLKMPAMILDEKEKMTSRFISSNGFVKDPCAIEEERALMNPWTVEEKEIFLEQLGIHGKDFSKIGSFLDHKTTADCVQFYYKNHKSDWFPKTKKKPVTNNLYLMTSGNRWSREMNSTSLDILGVASVMAAQADEAKKSKVLENVFEASSDERETAAADVLVGICRSLSLEGMSSCITSAIEQQKVGPTSRRPLTPEVTQNVDYGDTCSSDESCGEMDVIDWTDDEKSLFVRAFSCYGKDFVMISRCVRTKSRVQCKVFFSKARKCLGLDNVQPETGEGDAVDTGFVENDSVVYSDDKFGSRMDEDLTFVNQDVSKPELTVDDGVVGADDMPIGEDQPVTEDDTSKKVRCLVGGVGAEVGAGVSGVPTDPVVVGKLDFLAKSEARTDNHGGSRSSFTAEKPTRNGDVKLFGKILSKPSSADDDPTPSARESDSTKKHRTSGGNKFDMNLTVDRDTDDHNGFLGLENVPIGSYGFWDGTKIQIGFPSLPDSAILLAKYSSAFSSYPATVNVDECNLNGACVFSPTEFSPNHEKVQAFSLDLNPRPETLAPEVPRNGFNVVPGYTTR